LFHLRGQLADLPRKTVEPILFAGSGQRDMLYGLSLSDSSMSQSYGKNG
jgi:hypothetical protein